jgi:GNAT superfamily N-acetyltransferase
MDDDIITRRAGPEDIPVLCDLLEELFSIESDFAPDFEKQVKALSMLLTDPQDRSLVLVAVKEGKVVGMVSVQTLVSTAEGGKVGLVEDMIVDREFRRRGVGTILLNRAVEWGRSRKLKRLQLLADRENMPAVNFYAGNGWTTTKLGCLRMLLT